MPETLDYRQGIRILSRKALEREAGELHELLAGVEGALDSLLDGIDTYRATLPQDDPTKLHLRDLVDMANESRNNVRRSVGRQ